MTYVEAAGTVTGAALDGAGALVTGGSEAWVVVATAGDGVGEMSAVEAVVALDPHPATSAETGITAINHRRLITRELFAAKYQNPLILSFGWYMTLIPKR
jgi:hypothetical protein